jgi:hypothetical protein
VSYRLHLRDEADLDGVDAVAWYEEQRSGVGAEFLMELDTVMQRKSGADGQGKTKEEARESLAEAIKLILEDRRDDGLVALRQRLFETPLASAFATARRGTAATRREKEVHIRCGAVRRLALWKLSLVTPKSQINSYARSAADCRFRRSADGYKPANTPLQPTGEKRGG